MSSYTLEAIAASKVANFEKCLDEGHYLSQFSPLNLNSYNRKTILGTISHEIIAAFLLHENFEIDNIHYCLPFSRVVIGFLPPPFRMFKHSTCFVEFVSTCSENHA